MIRFSKENATAREVRNLAFAYFTRSEYPTHRMLQELMQLEASGADKDQVLRIATLLLPWCRDGNYGPLFDGESNITLTGKIAHFELGYIPEAAKELKSAAGFLITNYTRQHIITMPRAKRKRNVYEEVARFLDIPEGEKIVKESYAQMRKFNTWNISIVQQYSRFKDSHIRSAVFGNSRQFFMMKQNDRADLEDISRDIALPDITKQTIMNYPLPTSKRAKSIPRSLITTSTRCVLFAAPSTISHPLKCSIAAAPAANTSKSAPGNSNNTGTLLKELSFMQTPPAAPEDTQVMKRKNPLFLILIAGALVRLRRNLPRCYRRRWRRRRGIRRQQTK